MVFVASSLDRFLKKRVIKKYFIHAKTVIVLDHPKTGPICLVLGWSILGYPVLVKMDHPKSGFVRISDPHGFVFYLHPPM